MTSTQQDPRERDQNKLVAEIVADYTSGADRSQGLAATGVGKSHVASKVSQEIGARIIVITGPDKTVSQHGKLYDSHLVVRGGIRKAEIAEYLEGPGQKVVISTVQSLHKVAAILDELSLAADLLVSDEVHFGGTALRAKDADNAPVWAPMLTQDFPAALRLFMTATPPVVPEGLDPEQYHVYSMDDEALYGRMHSISHKESVEAGHIVPTVIYYLRATEDEALAPFADMAAGWELGDRMIRARELLAYKSIFDLIDNGTPDTGYHPQRIIVTMNTTADADEFARLYDDARSHLGHTARGGVFVIKGTTSDKRREAIYDSIRTLGGQTLDYVILVHVRVAERGLDIPDIDTVVFPLGVGSSIRAYQSVGRAARLPELSGKTHALVVVTDVLAAEDDPVEFYNDNPIVQTVAALATYDDTLMHSLKLAKEAQTETLSTRVVNLADENRELPDAQMLEAIAIEALGGEDFWQRFLRHAEAFVAAGGDINSIPAGTVVP